MRIMVLVDLLNLNRTGLNLIREIIYLTTLLILTGTSLLMSAAWTQTSVSTLLILKLPTVKLTKRKRKTQLKPWITSGILKSMYICDYFRIFIKAKCSETKAQYHSQFKFIET